MSTEGIPVSKDVTQDDILEPEETIPCRQATDREPKHPGETLKEYIELYELNNSRVADILGVTRNRISKIVNGHRTITADTAIRLSVLFEETDPEFWLNLSERRELWEQRQEKMDEYDEVERNVQAIKSGLGS